MKWQVEAADAGRADKAVSAQYPDASRRALADLFARGCVRIDGRRAKKGTRVAAGATIELSEQPATADEMLVVPDDTDVAVVYEDAWIVGLAKPPGIPSQPLSAGETGTAANALVRLFPDTAGVGDDPREAGLANRLDSAASGVLIAARDRASWQSIRDAYSAGRIEKTYLALVGVSDAPAGECDAPLAMRGARAAIDDMGLSAFTTWVAVASSPEATLLRCTSRTGRTHQIRAHLAHAAAPIVGDPIYGDQGDQGARGPLFLHAETVALPHPHSGDRIVIEAPLPELLAGVLREAGIE